MSLTSTDAVKVDLGITDSSSDTILQQIVAGIEKAVHTWTKRDVLESQTTTLFLSGSGNPDLILPHRPVTSITSVNVDPTGYYGTGPSAFAATTLWTEGTHFALIRDSGGVGTSPGKSAVLRRLGGSVPGGNFMFWPSWPMGARPGLLAASRAAFWPVGDGNIKVTMVAGYNPVPADLTLACNELAVMAYRRASHGIPLQSESYAGYSYSLAISLLTTLWKMAGTPAATIASYREVSIA